MAKMKNKLCILLVMLLLVQAVVFSEDADVVLETNNTIFAESNSYPAGGLQYRETFDNGTAVDGFDIGTAFKWTPSGAREEKTFVTGIEGIIVHKGNSAKDGTYFDYETEGPSASLIVEYDIRFEDLVKTGSSVTVRVYDLVNHTDTFPIALNFNGETRKVTLNSNPSSVFTEDIEDGKWYRVRHEIFATDASMAQQKSHSLWINGVAAFTKVPFASTNIQKFPNIQSVNIQKLLNNSNLGTTIYVDNFMVFKKNINSPVAPIEVGGILNAIRTAENKLKNADVGTGEDQYAEDTFEALKNAVEAAKSAYRDENRTEASLNAAAAALMAELDKFKVNGPKLKVDTPGIYRNETATTELTSLATATAMVVKTPIITSRFADPDGEKVAIVVMLFTNDSILGEKLEDIVVSDVITLPPATEHLEVLHVDLSQYTRDQRNNMFVRICAWRDFSTPVPYIIPAHERFR